MDRNSYVGLVKRGGAALNGRQYVNVKPWSYSPTEEVARHVIDAVLPEVCRLLTEWGYADAASTLHNTTEQT